MWMLQLGDERVKEVVKVQELEINSYVVQCDKDLVFLVQFDYRKKKIEVMKKLDTVNNFKSVVKNLPTFYIRNEHHFQINSLVEKY